MSIAALVSPATSDIWSLGSYEIPISGRRSLTYLHFSILGYYLELSNKVGTWTLIVPCKGKLQDERREMDHLKPISLMYLAKLKVQEMFNR